MSWLSNDKIKKSTLYLALWWAIYIATFQITELNIKANLPSLFWGLVWFQSNIFFDKLNDFTILCHGFLFEDMTDRRCYTCCEMKARKKIRLIRDSNPWPLRYWCSVLPTELWSHLGAGHFVSSWNTHWFLLLTILCHHLHFLLHYHQCLLPLFPQTHSVWFGTTPTAWGSEWKKKNEVNNTSDCNLKCT